MDAGDNDHIPAGFTYLGQFIDHDITLDLTSIAEKEEDPLATVNFRTPRLDLDALYGLGPDGSPQLYERNSRGPEIPDRQDLRHRAKAFSPTTCRAVRKGSR